LASTLNSIRSSNQLSILALSGGTKVANSAHPNMKFLLKPNGAPGPKLNTITYDYTASLDVIKNCELAACSITEVGSALRQVVDALNNASSLVVASSISNVFTSGVG